MKKIYISIALILSMFSTLVAKVNSNIIESTKGIVDYWEFASSDVKIQKSKLNQYELSAIGKNPIKIVNDGPISGKSILLDGTNFLTLPYNKTDKLNVKTNQVTVIAWVKWTGEQTGFVGGMWNEYADGGKRQYGLFVSLPHYNGDKQVCGHISKTGKPTPPLPFSFDYSASEQKVPSNQWSCVAFTYDGKYICSYFNGIFKERPIELIKNTKGFDGYPNGAHHSKNPYYFPDGIGDNGSDFTVGAVLLKRGMGNFFKGQIGGIAIYDRALSDKEIMDISNSFELKND